MASEDLVEEARDFVVTSALRTSPDRARGFIEALCNEVERLRNVDGELDDIHECSKCDLCEDHHGGSTDGE